MPSIAFSVIVIKPIWITDLKTLDTVTLPWTDSMDLEPVWVGELVYFLSDRDGVSNVWSYDTRSRAMAQLTRFTDFDVNSLESGAGVVVFEQAGGIHELDPAPGQSHVVPITATSDFPWMLPRWEDVARFTQSIALSPSGKRALVEARGEVFTLPAEKGDTRNVSRSSRSAEKAPAWSPDGKWVSWFSDASGEYELVIESQDGVSPPRRIALRGSGQYYTPSWSPDSKRLLYHDPSEPTVSQTPIR